MEYTLLKPDCHSWRISKMQSDTLEGRYAIKLCFKLGENATEKYGMLHTAFGASCMNRASVFEWHKWFKEGRESVRDDEKCGRSKEVSTLELIGTVQQVHCSRKRLLRSGLELHVCTINKSAHTKKNLKTYRMHLVRNYSTFRFPSMDQIEIFNRFLYLYNLIVCKQITVKMNYKYYIAMVRTI